MTYLPRLASVAQACAWLATETGQEWTLQRLMEHRLRPYFWLEHHPKIPQLSGGRPEGVMAEMVFAGDLQRLEFDGAEPFVTMFRTEDGTLYKNEPGFHIPTDELRFKRQEIEDAASESILGKAAITRLHSGKMEMRTVGGQSKERLPFRVYVQDGELIDFAALPHIVAKAMYPAASDLSQYALSRMNLDSELLEAVKQRELTVRNPSGMGEIKWATPGLLEGGVLLPFELRPYLRKRGIELIVLPHGSGPTYWTIENAAIAIAEQERLHDEARGSLLDAMVVAANTGEMTVRDPHTCLPCRQKSVRQFYELVTHEDVDAWLVRSGAPYQWAQTEVVMAPPTGPLVMTMAGRAALPVRALPYITGWGLSPDEIAKNLARKTDAFARMRQTVALHLVGTTPVNMQPIEWDAFVVKLDAFAAELRAQYPGADTMDQRSYAAWRQQAARLLPAGVFVWFDEFERDHRRDFSVDTVTFLGERGGERELNLTPFMEAETLEMVMEGFETHPSSRQPTSAAQPPPDDPKGFKAWYDETLNASDWWALSGLDPDEAAMLLCEQDPHEEPTPEKTTTSETTPLDYRKLLRAFEDAAKREPRPRTLSDWHRHASAAGLRYHSWIDRYILSMEPSCNANSDQAVSSKKAGNMATADFKLLATREQLIEAYGSFTGMDASWFSNLTDTPALLAARKVVGQGGRGRIAVPLFCPFEVMGWLANSRRRKGRTLRAEKAWELFEKNFPTVYNIHSVADPRTVD